MEVLEREVYTGGLTRDKTPAFVFQTNSSIFLQQRGKKVYDLFDEKDQKFEAKMKQIDIQRITKRRCQGSYFNSFAYETSFYAV